MLTCGCWHSVKIRPAKMRLKFGGRFSMMMECPRCGFQQPQDRYCANCGVDIEALSKAPEPLVQQLLKNQFFYLALAAVVLVGVYFTISKIQGPETSSSSVSEGQIAKAAPSQSPVARSAPSPTQNQTKEVAKQNAKALSASNVQAAQGSASLLEDNPDSNAAATTTAAGAAANTSAPATAEVKAVPRQMTTEFWEVPRESLNQIFSLSQILFEGAQSRMVMFPDSERLQSFLRSARKLSGGRNSPLTPNQAVSLAFGDATEDGLALSLEIMPNKLEAGLGELDLAVNFRGEASSAPIQWEASPSLRSKQVLLIAGLLPHKALNPELLKGLGPSPMQILESPDFLENQTEFLIVIELK